MARLLKPQKVDEIRVPFGGSLDIMLDRNEKKFFAEMDGERWEDASFDKLYSKVREDLQKLVKLQWFDVISVEIEDPDRWSRHSSYVRNEHGQFGMSISRFHAAKARSGWRQADWNTPEERRPTQSNTFWYNRDEGQPFTLPMVSPNGKTYLPYKEETWAGLLEILNQLNLLRQRAISYFGQPDQLSKVDQLGQQILRMLPEGTK